MTEDAPMDRRNEWGSFDGVDRTQESVHCHPSRDTMQHRFSGGHTR